MGCMRGAPMKKQAPFRLMSSLLSLLTVEAAVWLPNGSVHRVRPERELGVLLLAECLVDAKSQTQLKMQWQTKQTQHQLQTWLASLEGVGHRYSYKVTVVTMKAIECIL